MERNKERRNRVSLAVASHCSFAYSALASFRMGMSGSASFQRAKEALLRQTHALQQVDKARLGP